MKRRSKARGPKHRIGEDQPTKPKQEEERRTEPRMTL